MFAITLALTACYILGPDENGSTCGGAQYAAARAILPDTGIAAGAELLIGLVQHDPYLIGEETELVIQHARLVERGAKTEPDPRVRLVRDDGRALLDAIASRDSPAGTPPHSTWMVIRIFRSAELRIAIFEAIRDGKISLELWRPNATRPGTTVRLQTQEASVSEVTRCL